MFASFQILEHATRKRASAAVVRIQLHRDIYLSARRSACRPPSECCTDASSSERCHAVGTRATVRQVFADSQSRERPSRSAENAANFVRRSGFRIERLVLGRLAVQIKQNNPLGPPKAGPRIGGSGSRRVFAGAACASCKAQRSASDSENVPSPPTRRTSRRVTDPQALWPTPEPAACTPSLSINRFSQPAYRGSNPPGGQARPDSDTSHTHPSLNGSTVDYELVSSMKRAASLGPVPVSSCLKNT